MINIRVSLDIMFPRLRLGGKSHLYFIKMTNIFAQNLNDQNDQHQGFTGHHVPAAGGEDNHGGPAARSWKVSRDLNYFKIFKLNFGFKLLN